MKKSETIAGPDDLRKRREKGLKISKPTLLKKRRKNRSKSEPGNINTEEFKNLSSSPKKKEKSDSKGLKWLKNILPSPKSRGTKDAGEMADVQQSSDLREEISVDAQRGVVDDGGGRAVEEPQVFTFSPPEAPTGGIQDAVAQLALSTLPLNPEVQSPVLPASDQSPCLVVLSERSAESEASSKWGVSDSDSDDYEATTSQLGDPLAASSSTASLIDQSPSNKSRAHSPQLRKGESKLGSQNSVVSAVHIDLKKVESVEVQQKSEILLILSDGDIRVSGNHGNNDISEDVTLCRDREKHSGVMTFKNHPEISEESIIERHKQSPGAQYSLRQKSKQVKKNELLDPDDDDVFVDASSTQSLSFPKCTLEPTVPKSAMPLEVSTIQATLSQPNTSTFTLLPTTPITSSDRLSLGAKYPDQPHGANFIPHSTGHASGSLPNDLKLPPGFIPLRASPQGYFLSSPSLTQPSSVRGSQCPSCSQDALSNYTTNSRLPYTYTSQPDVCFHDHSSPSITSLQSGRSPSCQHKILCHLLRQPAIRDVSTVKPETTSHT